MKDGNFESLPQNTEDMALTHLLDEGRTGAFHARSESQKNGSTSTVSISSEGREGMSFTAQENKSTNYLGLALTGTFTERHLDARGNLLGSDRARASIDYLQMATIPFIPANVHLSISRTQNDANGHTMRTIDLQCHSPRYSSNVQFECQGTVRNGSGEIIARESVLNRKDGSTRTRVFKPGGQYLGEINSSQYTDPTKRVTTTDTTAQR